MYASGSTSTRFTLTAAHCAEYTDDKPFTNGAGQPMGVSDFIHELYGPNAVYDLGVVRLSPGKTNAPSIFVYEDSGSGSIPVKGYAAGGIPANGGYCVHGLSPYGVHCNLLSGGQVRECMAGHCFYSISMNSFQPAGALIWCEGDSGGPIYYYTSGGVIAAGVVSWLYHDVPLNDGRWCGTAGGASVVSTAVNLIPGLRVVTTSTP